MKSFTKIFLIIATAVLLGSCRNNTPKENVPQENAKNLVDALPFYHITTNAPQFVSKIQLDSLLANLSPNDNFLFVDLYPIIDTLPAAHEDNFILEERLEELGFEYVKYSGGRGNWQKGPRFYHSKYEKGNIRCSVYKMYQVYEKGEDDYYNMIVYEQIDCSEQ